MRGTELSRKNREDRRYAAKYRAGKMIRDYRWEVSNSNLDISPEIQSAIEYFEMGLLALAVAVFEDENYHDIAEAIETYRMLGGGTK